MVSLFNLASALHDGIQNESNYDDDEKDNESTFTEIKKERWCATFAVESLYSAIETESTSIGEAVIRLLRYHHVTYIPLYTPIYPYVPLYTPIYPYIPL